MEGTPIWREIKQWAATYFIIRSQINSTKYFLSLQVMRGCDSIEIV
jgi:hypothetical protein